MKIFLVGGAVRDTYLKKPVSDRDYVVVGGRHDKMLDLGYVQVGASFPVYLHPDTGEEYALARSERKVGEGYHGFETSTDNVTLEEDLSRRDFTINAMAIDMDTADLIDPHGGFKDLKAKMLRHVGPAFREDPLRVVRMARFLAKLSDDGFTVADETFFLAQQMVRNGELNELPWERFGAEVVKVLNTCSPDGCFTFFDVLDKLKAQEHIAFFDKMALRGSLMHAAKVAKDVKNNVTTALQEAVFAAAAFIDSERASHIGGSGAAKAVDAISCLASVGPTVEDLYELLKVTGAWNSGAWQVFIPAVQVLNQVGIQFRYDWVQLLKAAAVTAPCSSMGAELSASGLNGADIGQAIKQARLSALSTFNLAKSDTAFIN